MKRSPHKRYTNSWMDLCCDGMYKKERIKGATKKKMQKWTRNILKKELQNEIKEVL